MLEWAITITVRVCRRDDGNASRLRFGCTCSGKPKNDSSIRGRQRQDAFTSSILRLWFIHPGVATSVGVAVNILLLCNSMPEIATHFTCFVVESIN